jgi:hypothetical protein
MEKYVDTGLKARETEHEYSENPKDGGFEIVRKRLEKENPNLAFVLNEIKRSNEKKKIITEALIANSHDWFDIRDLDTDNAFSFGHLLAHWDDSFEGISKSKEQHILEAVEFAKKLR